MSLDLAAAGAANDPDNLGVYYRNALPPGTPPSAEGTAMDPMQGRLPIMTRDPNGMQQSILNSNRGKWPVAPNTFMGNPQGGGFSPDMGATDRADAAAISADPAMSYAKDPSQMLAPGFPRQGGASDRGFQYPQAPAWANMLGVGHPMLALGNLFQ